MRRLGGVVAAIALFLGLAWIDVEIAGDRDVFVPPPEAVAEQFLKTVVNKRDSRALTQLSTELQRRSTPPDVRGLRESLEKSIGVVQDVRGQRAEIEGDDATAMVEVKTDRGVAALAIALEREKGVWKIAALPTWSS